MQHGKLESTALSPLQALHQVTGDVPQLVWTHDEAAAQFISTPVGTVTAMALRGRMHELLCHARLVHHRQDPRETARLQVSGPQALLLTDKLRVDTPLRVVSNITLGQDTRLVTAGDEASMDQARPPGDRHASTPRRAGRLGF